MAEYAKIQKRIWNSQTFLSLSEDAKLLWLYLLTCPHGNMLGVFILKPGYVQEDLGWSSQRFTKSFGELLHKPLTNGCQGLIEYDEKTKIIWIKNFLEHNPIINPNQVKSALKKIEGMPYSELFEHVKLFIESLGKSLYKPLGKGFAKPVTVTVTVSVTNDSKESSVQDDAADADPPGPVFTTIPLKDNSDFNITESILQEFKNSFPNQDVEQTIREIRIWNIANEGRRKTRNGIMRHIAAWLDRNHNKGKNMISGGDHNNNSTPQYEALN